MADGARGTTYHADWAWIDDGPIADVTIDIVGDRFASVTPRSAAPPGAVRLAGLVLPGFANAHSHAFHRALRGRTHRDGGTFWTWREAMYAVASRLDPDTYLALTTATFAEMALAGVSCVGEFHYVHHAPGGRPYADPNVMGEALQAAAAAAGVRITLLDTCYLASGIGAPPRPEQTRFADADAESWADRALARTAGPGCRLGVAVHSVRAVPADAIGIVAAARAALGDDAPLHVHLSEQPAENAACLEAYGVTPTQLLVDHGAVGPHTTAVHATHLTERDIDLLGTARATAAFCPTTERDLADGIGPARRLREAGVRLALGSDQHAMIDLVEEARALEMHERLATLERGRFAPADLVQALTADGHACLGWPDAGRIEPGAYADLVTVRLDSVRTAGTEPAQALLAATAADVDTVITGGSVVVQAGQHRIGDVGRLLADAIAGLTGPGSD